MSALPDFPTRLRAERQRLGLSQDRAAEQLGIRRQTYAQLELRPDTDPRLSTLARLRRLGFRLRAIAPELTD